MLLGQTHRPTSTATALTPLSYRPYGRYLNTILEIIGYFNLFSPSAMPIGTPLKTPPSLRDTSSINRGGLKVLLFKFYLNSKRRCLFRRANPVLAHIRPCNIGRMGIQDDFRDYRLFQPPPSFSYALRHYFKDSSVTT